MISDMNLSGRHYRILVAIFTLNLLTSFASIAHYILSLLSESQASFVAGNVQVCSFFFHVLHILLIEYQCATSLFVCNLLVVVTSLYRRIRGSAEASEAATRSRARISPTESIWPAMIELAVVPIENCSTSGAHPNSHRGCGSLPPPPCDLTPTSTFPDLPQSRRPVETTMDVDAH